MDYLGIEPSRPKVAVFDFTGCEGCELQLANKEETLAAFLQCLDVVRFREVSSAVGDDYQVALVEGAITRDDEVERLRAIRARARVLVAMGSCACFGGVNRLKNAYDLEEANARVYGDLAKATAPTRALKEVVPVDLEVPGCPVNKLEIERVVQHLMLGVPFQFPVYPVCVDCKHRFTSCLMDRGQLCLGSITRAGCGAPCPAGGLGCWGCRGPADECNLQELIAIAGRRGFSATEIDERLAFFGGFEGRP
jgi:sulfhydrogenase subunit delta